MQFTPLGPWGVEASAGPATVGLKVDSGHASQILLPLTGGRVGRGSINQLTKRPIAREQQRRRLAICRDTARETLLNATLRPVSGYKLLSDVAHSGKPEKGGCTHLQHGADLRCTCTAVRGRAGGGSRDVLDDLLICAYTTLYTPPHLLSLTLRTHIACTACGLTSTPHAFPISRQSPSTPPTAHGHAPLSDSNSRPLHPRTPAQPTQPTIGGVEGSCPRLRPHNSRASQLALPPLPLPPRVLERSWSAHGFLGAASTAWTTPQIATPERHIQAVSHHTAWTAAILSFMPSLAGSLDARSGLS